MAGSNEPTFPEIAETIRRLEEMLDRVPDPLAREIRQKIAHLRALLLEQRSPNLVLIGRRGAGKSSLINALFGARVAEVGHVKAQTGRGRWFDVHGELGTLSILDTCGIQEGSRPEEADEAAPPSTPSSPRSAARPPMPSSSSSRPPRSMPPSTSTWSCSRKSSPPSSRPTGCGRP